MQLKTPVTKAKKNWSVRRFQVTLFLVADTRLYTLPCRSVRRYVGTSEIFLNCEWFLHYSPCPTIRDYIAVYPALFYKSLVYKNIKALKCPKIKNILRTYEAFNLEKKFLGISKT